MAMISLSIGVLFHKVRLPAKDMEEIFEYCSVTVVYRKNGRMAVPSKGLVDRRSYTCLEFNHRLMSLLQNGWEILAITTRRWAGRDRMAEEYLFRHKRG